MGTIFDKINTLPFLWETGILKSLSIDYRKKWANTFIVRDNWTLDESFSISERLNIAKDFWNSWIEWPPVDFIGMYCLGFTKQDLKTTQWRATVAKWCVDKWLVQVTQQKQEFKPSLNLHEIYQNFNNFKLNWYKEDISAFLITRWVPYDFIKKNTLLIWEIFKDIGYYDNYYCTEFPSYKDEQWNRQNQDWDKPKTVAIFMFPCYDENKELIWLKIRRKDWKPIRGKKSLALWVPSDEIRKKLSITKNPRTWLLYDKIDSNLMYLVEGEMDKIILNLLGYTNVIANQGWVQSLQKMIKSTLSDTDKIICLYDNDTAGKAGKQILSDIMKRPIYDIEYPVRENKDGDILTDVNDLYEVWYDTKQKRDKIFQNIKKVWSDNKEKTKPDFIYMRETMEIYDLVAKKMQTKSDVMDQLLLTRKELMTLVKENKIPTYQKLCYQDGWKPWCYNTLDEQSIIRHWWEEEPIIHKDIEKFLKSLCRNKKNFDWLNQAILYKITHLNDFNLPALVMYWPGWSWKWTLLDLLSKIVGEVNMMTWLKQKDLHSSFDSYQGEKLVVEYKEVSTWNTIKDRATVESLKWIIGEASMMINPKYWKPRRVDNIAWFHLSSNHPIPIQLDSKHSGNRRWAIIKTWSKLEKVFSTRLHQEVFTKQTIIKQYINWLYETYPDIPDLTFMPGLDNKEKSQLEQNCEGVANLFFEWFEKNYPHIWKITTKERQLFTSMYRTELWEDNDDRYKQKNFDAWLSHRYERRNVRIRWKVSYWYFINKTDFDREHIPSESTWEFKKWEVESIDGITF